MEHLLTRLADMRVQHEQRSGILSGLMDETSAAGFPARVFLAGLSREECGDRRFEILLHRAIRCAARLAPRQFAFRAVYGELGGPDAGGCLGYEFRFSNKLTAARFHLCHEAARAGRRCPSLP